MPSHNCIGSAPLQDPAPHVVLKAPQLSNGPQLSATKGALAVLTKLVWENMKTRCATSRQRLLSRLTTVERAWRPLVSDILTCDIQYIV